MLRCSPGVPSNSMVAMSPAVATVSAWDDPSAATRAADSTDEAAKYGGGMRKSPELVIRPPGVRTETRPAPAAAGTVTVRLVEVAAVITARVRLNVATSLAVFVSNPVPVMVTCVPAGPPAGEKLLSVGSGHADLTVKESALVADPAESATVTFPVLAPLGTVTTRLFTAADTTVAVVPLN